MPILPPIKKITSTDIHNHIDLISTQYSQYVLPQSVLEIRVSSTIYPTDAFNKAPTPTLFTVAIQYLNQAALMQLASFQVLLPKLFKISNQTVLNIIHLPQRNFQLVRLDAYVNQTTRCKNQNPTHTPNTNANNQSNNNKLIIEKTGFSINASNGLINQQ